MNFCSNSDILPLQTRTKLEKILFFLNTWIIYIQGFGRRVELYNEHGTQNRVLASRKSFVLTLLLPPVSFMKKKFLTKKCHKILSKVNIDSPNKTTSIATRLRNPATASCFSTFLYAGSTLSTRIIFLP